MEDMEADHALNGKIAVEMFENSTPGTYSAILMDVRMPVMNAHLTKPVEPDRLFQTLGELIYEAEEDTL